MLYRPVYILPLPPPHKSFAREAAHAMGQTFGREQHGGPCDNWRVTGLHYSPDAPIVNDGKLRIVLRS
jgi:hypothetical protein